MIGFSIMMWFCSALLIFVSFSLLKGNYSSVHGKVFETTNDRKGYAKALGKPVLLIGICLLFSGVIAVILPKDYAISIAVIFISINEQISNFAQIYPTNLKASSNEALLFMRRYRFANCSCFSCCFKDAYPSSNVQ